MFIRERRFSRTRPISVKQRSLNALSSSRRNNVPLSHHHADALGTGIFLRSTGNLFQDVYAWAGKPRTVRLSKQQSVFCYPEHIDHEMRRIFAALAAERHLRGLERGRFIDRVAYYLSEINAVHPFREGNGRTQLLFMTLLAERAGHPIRAEQLDPDPFLGAMIASFDGDLGPLKAVMRRIAGTSQQ